MDLAKLARPSALLRLATAALAGLASAQEAKLSLPFPPGDTFGRAVTPLLAPGEEHVVFQVRTTYDGPPASGLFTVPVTGGEPVELFPFGGTDRPFVSNVGFAGDRVVWRSGTEIYSAPFDGSAEAELLVTGTGLVGTTLDTGQVLFFAEGALHSVPADGSAAPTVLHPAGIPNPLVVEAISPTGDSVVYRVQGNERYVAPLAPPGPGVPLIQGTAFELVYAPNGDTIYYRTSLAVFRVPADASTAPEAVTPALPAGSSVNTFTLSPQGDQLAYLAGESGDDEAELLLVDLQPRPAVTSLVSGVNFFANTIAFSPDGGFVIHMDDPLQNQRFELFSVPVDGGPRFQLNPTLISDDALSFVDPVLRFAAGGTRVVAVSRAGRLYSSNVDGTGNAVLLLGQLPATPPTSPNLAVHPDGDVALYREPGPAGGLFAVPLMGGNPFRIGAAPTIDDPDVEDVVPFAGGTRVLFSAELRQETAFELLSAPIVGGPAVRLNGRLPRDPGGDVTSIAVTPDEGFALYTGTQFAVDRGDLLTAPLQTDGRTRPISRDLQPGDLVRRFGLGTELAPGGERVVFQVGQPPALFSAPVDGSGTPARLGPVQFELRSMAVSTDGRFCVFIDAENVVHHRMWLVPLDGRSEPRLLQDLGIESSLNRLPQNLRFTPDSSHLVYRQGESARRIVSASLTDLGATTEIATGGPGLEFELTPDGGSIVYFERNAPGGLFRASADGTGTPVELTDTGSGGLVQRVLFPDDERVAFTALEGPFVSQLHIVPLDGSAPPLQLSNASFRGVGHVVLDATHATYVQRAIVGQETLLVPLDGSAEPRLLASGDFTLAPVEASFALPGRVLYLGRASDGAPQEIYAVDVDGTDLPSPLTSSSGFGVQSFDARPGPRGGVIVYRATEGASQVFPSSLFQLDVRPGAEPVLLSEPVEGGSIDDFRLLSDRVVFLGDRDEHGNHELFAVPLKAARAGKLKTAR